MKDIELELSVQDVNLVLEALGAMPFVRVFALVGKIQEQARRQIEPPAAGAAEREGSDGSVCQVGRTG